MHLTHSVPARLYLLELSTHTLTIGEGRTLEMVLGCYLVVTAGGQNILIDTGMNPDSMTADAPPAHNQSNVIERLRELGLLPDDIDCVICTHFDVDHAGYHDSFPNAEFLVQRSHYELARGGHPRSASARQHWDHPSLRYRLIDGDTEILPGLRLLETGGHVTGHQSVLVHLPRTGPVLLAIDAVMLRRLFTTDRKASPLDENEAQLHASTQKLLEIVDGEGVSLVVFGHDGEQWQTLRRSPEFYD